MSGIKEKGCFSIGLVRILLILEEGPRRKISLLPPETCGRHLSAQDHGLLQLTGCFSSRQPSDLKGLAKRVQLETPSLPGLSWQMINRCCTGW